MSSFSLGGAVNGAADWVCSAPAVSRIVSSPVLAALLITLIAAVVVFATYPKQIRKAGFRPAARALIYGGMGVCAMTFVHYYAMERSTRSEHNQRGVREVFTSIQQMRETGMPGAVPVHPMGYAGAPPRLGGAPPGAAPLEDRPLNILDVAVPMAVAPRAAMASAAPMTAAAPMVNASPPAEAARQA
jgi:hypothetical protein